jgi:uncharacterized protein YbjT (DUF2867 family)
MRVAVVGGTGLVGRHVMRTLQRDGHEAIVVARSRGIDVMTGAGLDDALAGVHAVIDVANISTNRRQAAVDFFSRATEQLMAAERRADVGHHVVLSIVGIDDVDWGYYEGKRHQEAVALAGPVPVSVLRATQFHEFVAQILSRTRFGPVAVVPRMRVQTIAAREVASSLASLAVGTPVGRVADLAGPEPHDLPELARRLATSRGRRLLVLPLKVPGAAGRAMAGGRLLPGRGARLGQQTFDQWLRSEDAKDVAV